MSNTKHKILISALELFNEHGISSISLRTIANSAAISVGNLQYHFKKREDIIEALYFQLVEEIDNVLLLDNDLLKSFFDVSTAIITILYEYRFFLLDFITITRNNTTIKEHYATLSRKREKQFLEVIEILIKNGLFRKEEIEGEYKSLFKRFEVISNFWFAAVLIQANTLPKNTIKEYASVINKSLYPYLTTKAKQQYTTFFLS